MIELIIMESHRGEDFKVKSTLISSKKGYHIKAKKEIESLDNSL